jgi:hypothetical protein
VRPAFVRPGKYIGYRHERKPSRRCFQEISERFNLVARIRYDALDRAR